MFQPVGEGKECGGALTPSGPVGASARGTPARSLQSASGRNLGLHLAAGQGAAGRPATVSRGTYRGTELLLAFIHGPLLPPPSIYFRDGQALLCRGSFNLFFLAGCPQARDSASLSLSVFICQMGTPLLAWARFRPELRTSGRAQKAQLLGGGQEVFLIARVQLRGGLGGLRNR